MLDATNRQALTQMLRPPSGFRLYHAVGTTFTLDMTSALSVPLSFVAGYGEDLPIRSPFSAPCAKSPTAWTSSAKQATSSSLGRLRPAGTARAHGPPGQRQTRPVSPQRSGYLNSREARKRRYRFLCSSRNLTTDASWDLLVRLDGEPVQSPKTPARTADPWLASSPGCPASAP